MSVPPAEKKLKCSSAMMPLFKWTGTCVEFTPEDAGDRAQDVRTDASVFAGVKRVKRSWEDAENVAPRSESPKGLMRKLNLISVPAAVNSGDRLSMFDVDKKKLEDLYFDVPQDAYDGMVMHYAYPPSHMRLLLVDGTGYRVGGTVLHQHAVRLQTHRAYCNDERLPGDGLPL